jgi:hypothetical protein
VKVMLHDIDLNVFIKEPRRLVELCRKVVDLIDSESNDLKLKEMEVQLREIAGSVEKLEKIGVAVPDVLRAEKTRLAAELATKDRAQSVLKDLADGLKEISEELDARLGVPKNRNQSSGQPKQRKKGSKLPKTDPKILRQNIIQALEESGGRAKVKMVIELMGHQLNGKLLKGDLEWRESTGEFAWQNNAKWERYRMVQDGILRGDSPRGYWELNRDRK